MAVAGSRGSAVVRAIRLFEALGRCVSVLKAAAERSASVAGMDIYLVRACLSAAGSFVLSYERRSAVRVCCCRWMTVAGFAAVQQQWPGGWHLIGLFAAPVQYVWR
jgi:hypothetical protein